jgi:hypothetical protein
VLTGAGEGRIVRVLPGVVRLCHRRGKAGRKKDIDSAEESCRIVGLGGAEVEAPGSLTGRPK